MEYVGSFNQFSLRSLVAGCWEEAEINPLFWAWWHELCKPLTILGELQTIQKYSAMYYLLSKDAQAEINDPKMRPSLKSLHKWLSICWSTLMKKASLGFLGLCTVHITVMAIQFTVYTGQFSNFDGTVWNYGMGIQLYLWVNYLSLKISLPKPLICAQVFSKCKFCAESYGN